MPSVYNPAPQIASQLGFRFGGGGGVGGDGAGPGPGGGGGGGGLQDSPMLSVNFVLLMKSLAPWPEFPHGRELTAAAPPIL